jgi:hypothetical protein
MRCIVFGRSRQASHKIAESTQPATTIAFLAGWYASTEIASSRRVISARRMDISVPALSKASLTRSLVGSTEGSLSGLVVHGPRGLVPVDADAALRSTGDQPPPRYVGV